MELSMSSFFPIKVHLNGLRLADVVELFEGPFGTAVVTQITKDEVTLTRPYGVTGDFSYTGGVPYSVGNEVCKYLTSDTRYTAKSHTFKVWQRKDLR
jgi:hypothetical protein